MHTTEFRMQNFVAGLKKLNLTESIDPTNDALQNWNTRYWTNTKRLSSFFSIVKVGAWIPHHDRHSSVQSHTEICKGMPPKGAPKSTSRGPSSDTVEQATILTGAVNIQSPKGPLFALGGLALLATSCQKPRMDCPYILGHPLLFHKVSWRSSSRTINFHMKFTMNKFEKKCQKRLTPLSYVLEPFRRF